MSAHRWGGHTFIGLHLPGVGDYFYDISTGSWHRRKEISSARHLAHDFVSYGGTVYAGDRSAGSVYKLDRSTYTHNSNAVRRVATAILPVADNRPVIENLTAEFQAGVGLVTGQGSDPKCLLRFAPDGLTYGNEIERSFGKRGEFGVRAVFDDLPRFEPPAVAFELATSEPVPATVTGFVINRNHP
jgi:hypothetical protein